MSELHVVLGSNGGTGSTVLEELTRRELPARGVTRSGTGFQPQGAALVEADITDPDAYLQPSPAQRSSTSALNPLTRGGRRSSHR